MHPTNLRPDKSRREGVPSFSPHGWGGSLTEYYEVAEHMTPTTGRMSSAAVYLGEEDTTGRLCTQEQSEKQDLWEVTL